MSGRRGGAGASDRVPAATPEEIEERLRAQRASLAASIDELISRVDPRAQARLTGEDLREQAETRLTALRDQTEARVTEWRERGRSAGARAKEGLSRAHSDGAHRLKEAGGRLRGLFDTSG